MHSMTFITLAHPGRGIAEPLLLAGSLREFGGKLADSQVIALYPNTRGDFNEVEQRKFKELDVQTMPFGIDPSMQEFPFGTKVEAAAFAENKLAGGTALLAWLDGDTLVINEPEEFILEPGKNFGYSSVHHRLIGLEWGAPFNLFWNAVYHHCEVSNDAVFSPMTTHTGEKIRPYFSAGCFVLRPEMGILSRWRQVFRSCYQSTEFIQFFRENDLYTIFLHQALFTAVILNMIEPGSMRELNHSINYPLHLHNEMPEHLQAKRINDLTTARYEDIFDDPDWNRKFPLLEPLSSWIMKRILPG